MSLISALALPMILVSLDKHRRTAIFKESFNVVQNAVYRAKMEGVSSIAEIVPYINSVKTCPTNYLTEGCIDNGYVVPNSAKDAGVVLHNGAVLYDLEVYQADTGTLIDLNGNDGPNTPGEDIFYIQVNLRDEPWSHDPNVVSRPGEARCSPQITYDECTAMFE